MTISELHNAAPGENSAAVAARVAQARARQAGRFAALGSTLRVNAEAQGETLDQITRLEDDARAIMLTAAEKLKLSARAWHRTLRVARTIADLEGDHETLQRYHVAEALSYRRLRLADL